LRSPVLTESLTLESAFYQAADIRSQAGLSISQRYPGSC
jgi:hypothetical protein